MEKVGLVTITFNGESVVEDFITSVNKQDYLNFSLYVIDNNSSDKSVSLIESNSTINDLKVIKNSFNNGVAGGNNQGIKQALKDGCEYVILINNDTIFEDTLISKLVQASKAKGYDVVVPKMMYFSNPEIIWFAGGFLDKNNGYSNCHVGMKEKDVGQYHDCEITYAPTCCALIHRSVFEDIGLMDEKYFVYFDDTDFWYRMLKNGKHKMLYINDVFFLHKEGSLTKSKSGTFIKFKFGDFIIRQTTRNKVYYLRKQKTVLAYAHIIIFWIRLNLRFLFSGKYNRNFRTWILIQTSFKQGIFL
ncbi:glycosyltransferase family 2 protein [Parafilimonas terrae]|uniref:Glycosyltransferase 2-like domain-containing protein n=1 Tax=Parafilimonas terrae TaxID=1465490 RepID=A0A1I5Z4T6_9BACT|nr:glycosyltransferase family 2 protein [Parafilimonas terrae]SFQ51471.1 hypothetical protein SAMN05444277_11683 [Parafilimonas terrae]